MREGMRTNYIGNRKLWLDPYCAFVSNGTVTNSLWKKARELNPIWSDVSDFKSNKIDFEEFKRRYYSKVLNKLDPHEIAKRYNGYYLLCFEADCIFCHRSIIAEWLRSYGYNCEEGLF